MGDDEAERQGADSEPPADAGVSRVSAPWKHLLISRRVAEVDARSCTRANDACTTCSDKCPLEGAVTLADDRAKVQADICDGCGECAEACPAGAITLLPLRRGKNRGPIIM